MHIDILCVCVCACRKFNKTIEILQGDIESLENEKLATEKRLDEESKKSMLGEPTVSTRRTRGAAAFGTTFGLQREDGATGAQQEGAQPPVSGSPLALARVCVVCRLLPLLIQQYACLNKSTNAHNIVCVCVCVSLTAD